LQGVLGVRPPWGGVEGRTKNIFTFMYFFTCVTVATSSNI
jgi:hypothetical protein